LRNGAADMLDDLAGVSGASLDQIKVNADVLRSRRAFQLRPLGNVNL
jgi:hypothetical protein